MKKLILSATAIVGLAQAGHAQQVVFTDYGDANSEIDTAINGVLNETTDLNLQLLVGSSAGAVTTDVVMLLLSQTTATLTTDLGTIQPAKGDITLTRAGIDDNTVNEYLVPAGTDYYQVLAWLGNYNSYAAAAAAGEPVGESSVLQFVPAPAAGVPAVGIDLDGNQGNTGPTAPAINLVAVPEPSTLAMAGVGLASMLPIAGSRLASILISRRQKRSD